MNMAGPKNEDWDPEYTPKSKQYYLVGTIFYPYASNLFQFRTRCSFVKFSRSLLQFCLTPVLSFPLAYPQHDDRDGEAQCKWMDNRGRGRGSFLRGRARFIIRKATGGSNTNSPRWAHDKFQVNGEQDGAQEEETEQDHKVGET